jgi:nitric oxide reductase NorD protein
LPSSPSQTDPLETLAVADPDLADRVNALLADKPTSVADRGMIVEETLAALGQEITFGRSVAEGLARLVGEVSQHRIDRYRRRVREAGATGPTLGTLMATHLVPVLRSPEPGLFDRFTAAVQSIRAKGDYGLKPLLKGLDALLHAGEGSEAAAYLELIEVAYRLDLTYRESTNLAYDLPRAILRLPADRRLYQTDELRRAMAVDLTAGRAMMEGLERGLTILSADGLIRFVSDGLDRYRRLPRLGARFLSLDAQIGRDALASLQVTVPLSQVRQALDRYLRARTGMPLGVRPLSEMAGPGDEADNGISVRSDGRWIYLPEEIDRYGSQAENRDLFRGLAKLESALYELGTYDFDLDRAAARPDIDLPVTPADENGARSDLARFWARFRNPRLARDLFTIFEHGRLRYLLGREYPGILRRTDPLLRAEVDRLRTAGLADHPLFALYLRIALDLPTSSSAVSTGPKKALLDAAGRRFADAIPADPRVETSAGLVRGVYAMAAEAISIEAADYPPLHLPFGRRIAPERFFEQHRRAEEMAAGVKITLEKHGISVYKSDVRRCLTRTGGSLSPADLQEIAFFPEPAEGDDTPADPSVRPDLSAIDLSALMDAEGIDLVPAAEPTTGPVFWHREWDCELGDYLADHVRVAERRPGGAGGVDFYDAILAGRAGLVRRIRRAFEMLKPEGLTRLRRWREGDELDYRAMIDFAVDRRSGRTPSERIYIKRLKAERDVAVLLLVDLSRSTANPAAGSEERILDIEKTAIVLFCEALGAVGDSFSVAGFSGSGRLGVDYYRIKDFDEAVDDAVKGRIGAMAPRRSTRMGAALRHAAARLEAVPARVKLMLLISDGFPNDLDYKRRYAVEDTRRAILEASARRIHTRAITVNLARAGELDDLYGPLRHNVISDVRELPDRLLGIYRALTR